LDRKSDDDYDEDFDNDDSYDDRDDTNEKRIDKVSIIINILSAPFLYKSLVSVKCM